MKKSEIMIFLLVVCVLIFSCCVTYHYTEKDDEKIRRYLIEQGYKAEHMEFTRTDFMRGIYQASEPIDIGTEELVECWEIHYWGRFSLMYEIRPYPNQEVPAPVLIELRFTSGEYEELQHRAADQPLEEYLKYIILNHIE